MGDLSLCPVTWLECNDLSYLLTYLLTPRERPEVQSGSKDGQSSTLARAACSCFDLKKNLTRDGFAIVRGAPVGKRPKAEDRYRRLFGDP